jgi:hypothetical protein
MRNSFSKNKDIHKFTWPQDGKINRAWRDQEMHLQEKFKVRLLNDESIKWLCKKEWMNVYSSLKKM